jgi:prolipoprotein diacylglyceryltransferase
MAAMWLLLLAKLARRDRFWLANGFYLVVGWYGLQRFVWEFFKPYATLIGPFNLFHVVCAGLVLYAVVMIRRTPVS